MYTLEGLPTGGRGATVRRGIPRREPESGEAGERRLFRDIAPYGRGAGVRSRGDHSDFADPTSWQEDVVATAATKLLNLVRCDQQ